MKYMTYIENWDKLEVKTMQMYTELKDGHISLSEFLDWRLRVWCEQYEARETIERLRIKIDEMEEKK